MQALDTNILIRFLTNDDPKQSRVAERLIQQKKCSIALTVFLEAEWAMRIMMGYPSALIIRAYRDLLELENIYVPQSSELMQALDGYEAGMDFGDAIHAAQLSAEDTFLTFDKAFVKKASAIGFKNIQLLK